MPSDIDDMEFVAYESTVDEAERPKLLDELAKLERKIDRLHKQQTSARRKTEAEGYLLPKQVAEVAVLEARRCMIRSRLARDHAEAIKWQERALQARSLQLRAQKEYWVEELHRLTKIGKMAEDVRAKFDLLVKH